MNDRVNESKTAPVHTDNACIDSLGGHDVLGESLNFEIATSNTNFEMATSNTKRN